MPWPSAAPWTSRSRRNNPWSTPTAETYRLANSRFDKGIDSYLGVLDAQRSLFAAQQVLVFLRLEKLASQVTLYAVLGGGWQTQQSAGVTAMSGGPLEQGHN